MFIRLDRVTETESSLPGHKSSLAFDKSSFDNALVLGSRLTVVQARKNAFEKTRLTHKSSMGFATGASAKCTCKVRPDSVLTKMRPNLTSLFISHLIAQWNKVSLFNESIRQLLFVQCTPDRLLCHEYHSMVVCIENKSDERVYSLGSGFGIFISQSLQKFCKIFI